MKRIGDVVRVMAGVVALLVMMPPSAPAQEKNQAALVKKQAAPAQGLRRTAAVAVADRKPRRLILQVNSNDPAMMNLALNNATNVAQYYKDLGENVAIDIVTFGPGLHMLRDDTSPVKAGSRLSRKARRRLPSKPAPIHAKI